MTPELTARYHQRVPRYTSYPTAPHCMSAITAGTYAAWLSELAPGQALSLYLHVPFCAEPCLCCGCNTAVTRNYKAIAFYVDCLEREIELVTKYLPGRMGVTHIHWGGGTPAILSSEDLRRLSQHLYAVFDIKSDSEIAVEIDPRTVTSHLLAALAHLGGDLCLRRQRADRNFPLRGLAHLPRQARGRHRLVPRHAWHDALAPPG